MRRSLYVIAQVNGVDVSGSQERALEELSRAQESDCLIDAQVNGVDVSGSQERALEELSRAQ